MGAYGNIYLRQAALSPLLLNEEYFTVEGAKYTPSLFSPFKENMTN